MPKKPIKKSKTYKITVEFDHKESAETFLQLWSEFQEGIGMDWWEDHKGSTKKNLRLRGNGWGRDPYTGEVLSPEEEAKRFQEELDRVRGKTS